MIGNPHDTIIDRSIPIEMRRKSRNETAVKPRAGRDLRSDFEHIQRRALRWVDDHTDELRAAQPDIPAELNDRAGDMWFVLLAIADTAGGSWPRLVREVAVAL